VVTIDPFGTDEEAIRSAKDTPYGLNAMIFFTEPKAVVMPV
jgi:acyl-CoA reductase-like NAD-dependent aldehyde dehydrogenase